MVKPYSAIGLRDVGKRPELPDWRRAGGKAPHPEDFAKDTGCRGISPSCLIYPLPKCISEYPREQQAKVRRRFQQEKQR